MENVMFKFEYIFYIYAKNIDRIGGVMVSVLVSSAVDRGFKPRSGQIKEASIYSNHTVFLLSCLHNGVHSVDPTTTRMSWF
jgi:hypothetical protein